jgi:hypothetical protein
MGQSRPRSTARYTRRAGDIGIRQPGDLVQIDRLPDERVGGAQALQRHVLVSRRARGCARFRFRRIGIDLEGGRLYRFIR